MCHVVCQVDKKWYKVLCFLDRTSFSSFWWPSELCFIGCTTLFLVYDSSQDSCGATLQKVTFLNTHSPPSLLKLSLPTLPPTWTSLAPGPQECCVCNVTTIFYSCWWSVWVALLETGTQSLLPVNTNLMGWMAGKSCSSWGKMACIRNEQQRCVRHEQKAARGKKWQRGKCLRLEKG